MKKLFTYCLLLIAFSSLHTSCKKDSFITSNEANVRLSTDSLKYDTVFTTTGSITKSFKIINENNQKLLLNKVKLMGGSSSAYKINVDGVATTEANNIEVAANDSIYVFVSVQINPTTANLPFIISDSVEVNYNGNNRYVQLQAFGQNAVFLRNQTISSNTTWSNSKPYVILDRLTIATNVTLTIPQGTKIYLHANAPVLVDGTLSAIGTKNEPVVFTGDRLDENYKDLPASWPGIYFREFSKNNVLQFTSIKNAYQAVVAEKPSVNANPKVILQQCIIDNAFDAGVLCVNSSLQANNSLISNCGSNVFISYGGDYVFTNCTIATYSTNYIAHKNQVLGVTNFANTAGGVVTANLNAIFINNIFWGDAGFVDNEVQVAKQGSNTFNVLFENNLYRNATNPTNATLTNNIANQNPMFDSIDVVKRIFNFKITKDAAPGINKGVTTGFVKDLDDNNRSIGLPDLGCYEKQ
ncbi:MAG: hypothetical protein IPP48_08360 [Chitinophagaceae bacterium]|nr:hypothetical protein [Chitinophagaceae bacterium]